MISDPKSLKKALMVVKSITSSISPDFGVEKVVPKGFAEGGAVDDVGKTIPESPHTIALQRQMLVDGKKAAVLHTSGSSVPPPEGMAAMHIPDGLLHYNPQMVSPQQIVHAVHSNRLNDVLGLGPYSKDDIFSRLQQGEQPLAVVIRDQGGHEALSSFGTHATAEHQIAAMRHQVPDGGSIGVEPVENVLRERVGHFAEGGDVDEHDLVAHPVGGAMMAMHTPVQKTGEGVMSRDEELARNPVKLGKFSMPLSEVSATTVSKGTLQPWHEFNPEKAVQEKARIFPAVGDRSAAGQMLTHVGDTELTNPVNLTGGADYMRSEYSKGETPSSWASRPIPARKMAERIQKRTPEGSTAYMAHVNMGIPSADSSHMMAQSILRQIPSSKITKANLKKFNETIEEKLPGWPGVENTEEAEKFILRRPGTNISYLSKLMDQSRWKKAGFPNVGQTRFAVADPRLLSAPQLSVGYALSKAATHGNLNKNPEHKHETYAGQIPSEGGYAGGLKHQVPASVIFPDWWKNLRPNARAPKGTTKAQHALMTQFPAQEANQEWLDNLMPHIEEHKKVWGYNDGGTVNKALSVASKATKAKHKTHSR